MLTLKRALTALVFGVVLVAGATDAFAIATLEVTVTNTGDAVPGEKISLFTSSGKQVKEKKNTDQTATYKDLEPGTYTIKSGDKTIRTVTIDENDTVKRVSVTVPAAFIRVPNLPNSDIGWGIRGLAKYALLDSRIDHAFAGSPIRRDTGFAALGLALDAVMRPPNMGELFLMATLGYLPNSREDALKTDLHPGAGIDTFTAYEELFYFRAMVGYTLWEMQTLSLDLMGGVQATQTRFKLSTNETGGGGSPEEFSTNRLQLSPVLGLQGRHRLPNAPNTSLYGGLTFTHMNGLSVNGRSGLGNNYHADSGNGWQSEVSAGLLFNF